MKRTLSLHKLFFFASIFFFVTHNFCANDAASDTTSLDAEDPSLQATPDPSSSENQTTDANQTIPSPQTSSLPEPETVTPPAETDVEKTTTQATEQQTGELDSSAPAPQPQPVKTRVKKPTPRPAAAAPTPPPAESEKESADEAAAEAELEKAMADADTVDKAAADPATPKETTEDGVPIDFPIIGTVTLYPFDDPETNESGVRVYLPAKGKKLEWGPLIIGNGRFQQVGEKLQYFADASLFGSAVTLGIKDVQKGSTEGSVQKYSKIVFGITYQQKSIPTLKEPLTGQEIQLNSIDLVLEQTKPIQLIATTTLFKQKVTLTFAISKTETDAIAQLKAVPLVNIIPSVKGTPLEGGKLNSFTITFKNIVSKDKKPRELIITGSADLSTTPGLDQTEEVKSIELNITASSTQQSFKATADKVTIPALGTIAHAELIADFSATKKEVKLNGTSNIKIPSVGTFATKISAEINRLGMVFDSKIEQTARFADIDIHDVELKFATANKTLTLIGDATIEGYTVQIQITKDKQDEISASAALSEKELKPFSALNTPIVSDIAITNPSFKFIKKAQDYEMQLHGDVTLFGIPLSCNLFFKKASGKTVTLAEIEAPKDWKLSDGIHQLRGTLFEQITIQELNFVFSSDTYVDTTRDMTFRAGFNFISQTKLNGPLVPVSVFTKTSSESLITLQGYIDTSNPLNSVFKAQIPSGVVLKQGNNEGQPRTDMAIGKLALEIAGNPVPSFSLLTSLQIRPTPKDELLVLTGRIMFRPPSITFAGTLQGTWKDPLGIKNLEITDVAAEIAFGPAFPETGVPDSIGIAGEMAIGKRHFAMAMKVPIANQSDSVMCGALDKLTLEDLIEATEKIAGKDVSFGALPDALGIKDLKMYMVPKDTTIGELVFQHGLTMRGVIFIPGFTAMGNITISSSGFIVQASCSEIRYGPLVISRANEDLTLKAENDPAREKNVALEILQQKGALAGIAFLSRKHAEEVKATAQAHANDPAKEPPVDAHCKPDNTLLTEYNGPTMRVTLSTQQPLEKQGIFVSGLFKLANIFEEDAWMRIDKGGIEFTFETGIGKAVYNGKPLLDSKIFGKSSGSLKSPNFTLSVDFQNNFQAYLLDQIKAGIKTAKIEVTHGVATAVGAVNTTKALDPADVGKKVEAAQHDVEQKKEKVRSLNEDINRLKRRIGACT